MSTRRETTLETCHCGASFDRSDHCPECYCEQFEAYCEHVHVPESGRMNTTTEHNHFMSSYDTIIDSLDSEYRCDCDDNIVGGPREHSGERFVEHMRREDGQCNLALVCAAHLPFSVVFVSREIADIESIELESLTAERELELRAQHANDTAAD